MRVYFYSVCGGTDNCHNCHCKNIWRQKVGLVVISCHLLLTADRLELLSCWAATSGSLDSLTLHVIQLIMTVFTKMWVVQWEAVLVDVNYYELMRKIIFRYILLECKETCERSNSCWLIHSRDGSQTHGCVLEIILLMATSALQPLRDENHLFLFCVNVLLCEFMSGSSWLNL